MTDPAAAADTFRQAAALNREDPLLTGSLLTFPAYGQLVMTGDLHGHRRNWERLRRYCDLAQAGARHVILHEIIHEESETFDGPDSSHEMLLEAAQWKIEFPEQVHFLQSNHELAQLTRNEITKNGRRVTVAFEESVAEHYQDRSGRVMTALLEFLASYPLAGRTANRVFVAHSLPSPHELPLFDVRVLARRPTKQDLSERGSAHSLVWGRYHTAATMEELVDLLDADFFICGHQPQETGYDVQHDRLIILASNHNHGVFLPIDLGRPATLDLLIRNIRPLASLE